MFTRKNPNGTYRIPLNTDHEIRILSDRMNVALHGDIVDRLGAYEATGLEPEELVWLTKLSKDKLKKALSMVNITMPT